jgi:hypothetical protein
LGAARRGVQVGSQSGNCGLDELYVADVPSKALILPISLLVAPYALGKRQFSAGEGEYRNSIGTADGSIRGTIIANATTNKMTNPVFGHERR